MPKEIIKTDNFFLIHNFNTVPDHLIEYCKDYLIVDASTDNKVTGELERRGYHYLKKENTGHNITSYFSFFAEHYDDLPAVINLLKGNMIGRHCSEEYFAKVYNNQSFTWLYSANSKERARDGKEHPNGEKTDNRIGFLVAENMFIELNSSWYAGSPNHPKKYFDDFDDLVRFIYKDPIIPKYCCFSPGACYIVRAEQVRRHSKEFYLNLNKLMNYGLDPNFPCEAHMVERLLPVIFNSAYLDEVNSWMENMAEMDEKLLTQEEKLRQKTAYNRKRFKYFRKLFHKIFP